MGKFSPRRIITMIILIIAALAGIILGAVTLTHKVANGTTGQSEILAKAFDPEFLKGLPHNNYWGRWNIAYYGGLGAIAAGAFAALLFIIGLVLTLIKGKSFGWIMLFIGFGLMVMALSMGFLAHVAVKDLSSVEWLINPKNLPHAPIKK
ncbi:hypothetical protein [Mycoplasma todarodis]|uniref:Uncharacterized protein n=1 Tax=Mycoplasma todarodis TaxID=1937191 RepID=A0A4R0XL50_9MOLU|nr:hypothetical protein [Mycoplasma todarodis]TCG11386.1 hypothetical protein C4B25_01670 [Mycoplasma todarodis]